MLKRPSARRKSPRKQIELNLVPILDTLVTLISFLLFTMSFLSLVTIESPAPIVSADDVKEKLKELPLQLTLTLKDTEVEIWSPFDRIAAQKIPHLAEGKPDLKSLHEALLKVKEKFNNEQKIIFAPTGTVSYDVLVATMDAVRSIEKTDPPIYRKNPQTNNDEPLKLLFPEIVFGNILGDS